MIFLFLFLWFQKAIKNPLNADSFYNIFYLIQKTDLKNYCKIMEKGLQCILIESFKKIKIKNKKC